MALTYLNVLLGKIKQITAVTTGGSGKENSIVGTDATGRLAMSLMPVGIGPETITAKATSSLTAGDFVFMYKGASGAELFKADASPSSGAVRPATGFVLVDVGAGATATVYSISNTNTSKSGLIIGDDYWLSTGGGITNTPPVTPTWLCQYIGKADTVSSIVFSNVLTIELA
jgi:hypothetical protein